jgi:hypothetical protein
MGSGDSRYLLLWGVTMIVYRMQDIDGRGPWKPGFSHLWIEDREDHDNLLPSYAEFSSDVFSSLRGSKYPGCGCVTLEQLKRWFTKSEYETLLKHDYQCVAMAAIVVARSKTQCMFRRDVPLNRHFKVIELY